MARPNKIWFRKNTGWWMVTLDGKNHQGSNVETTVMMVKTNFGDAVRSKSEVAAKNEVLCKMLCHNLCCLISAMYELAISPEFT